jgi:hypothetical protein
MGGIRTRWRVFISSWQADFYISNATVGNRPIDAIDATSRVRGAEIRMRCGFGSVGTATGTIEIDNADGLYTPVGYNEDAVTYDSSLIRYGQGFDWHAVPIFVVPQWQIFGSTTWLEVTAGGEHGAGWFSGIVSSVEYYDDGFDAKIILAVDDWFTYASRSYFPDDVSTTDKLYNLFQNVILSAVPAPSFGADLTTGEVAYPETV